MKDLEALEYALAGLLNAHGEECALLRAHLKGPDELDKAVAEKEKCLNEVRALFKQQREDLMLAVASEKELNISVTNGVPLAKVREMLVEAMKKAESPFVDMLAGSNPGIIENFRLIAVDAILKEHGYE